MPTELPGVIVSNHLEVSAPLPGDGVVEFDADVYQLIILPSGVTVNGFRALSGGSPLSYNQGQFGSIIVQTLSGTATLAHNDGSTAVGERIMCRSGANANVSVPTRIAWMWPSTGTEHRWYAPV